MTQFEEMENSPLYGENKKRRRHAFLPGILVTALITLLIGTGALICYFKCADKIIVDKKEFDETKTLLNEYGKFIDIHQAIEKHFLGETNDRELMDAACRALTEELHDPYSRYLLSADLHDLEENLNNSFTGTGIVCKQEGDALFITDVLVKSPAAIAGLQAGDRILSVDGKRPASLQEAVSLLKGDAGTEVTLRYRRGNKEEEVGIIRGKIEDAGIEAYPLSDKIGYIRIHSFGAQTAEDFERALSRFEKGKAAALVLDLRGNPGGILKEGIAIADRLLPDGEICSIRDKSGKVRKIRSDEESTSLVLGVLVDGGTASTAELLAGTLQSHNKAYLMGSRTFGKGVIQEMTVFKDRTALNLTVEEFFLPGGKAVSKSGITPDKSISDGKKGEDAALSQMQAYLEEETR